jgi:hypothetical protein
MVSVELLINVDGIPVHKLSSKEFRLIQCICSYPFVIALYYGKGKPASVHEFVEDFLQELNT